MRPYEGRLPDPVMEGLLTSMREANDYTQALERAVLGVFTFLNPDLVLSGSGRVACSDYAIPDDQWRTLADALAAWHNGPIGRSNAYLDWANYGPAATTEGETP